MDNKQYKFKGVVIRCTYNTPDYKIYAMEVSKRDYPEIKQNKYNNVSILGELSDLTLGVDKVTSTTSKYTQTGGNLSITGNKLTLNEGSSITGGNIALDGATITSNTNSEIKDANVSMQNSSTIEFNNGKTNSMKLEMDDSANTINIAEGSGFNVIGGEIRKETQLGINGGLGILGDSTVTVDSADTWNGKISLVDGTLILDNVASAGQFEAQSGTLKILGSNTSLKLFLFTSFTSSLYFFKFLFFAKIRS